jgi:hypothetical protein
MVRQKEYCMGLEISSPLPNERNDVQLSLPKINPFSPPFKGMTFSSIVVNMNIKIYVNRNMD